MASAVLKVTNAVLAIIVFKGGCSYDLTTGGIRTVRVRVRGEVRKKHLVDQDEADRSAGEGYG